MVVLRYEVRLTQQGKQDAVSNVFEPEDEVEKKKAVEEIQQWIRGKPGLKARDDEKMVLHFLRSCKYRPERTKFKITNYYQLRAKEHCWFKNRDPENPAIMAFLKLGVFLPLREHDAEGRTVILVRTAIHDPRKQTVMDLFKVGKMIIELLIELDETISVYGVQAVLDLSGNTLAHTLQLTPSEVSKAVHAWQDCYPVRTRSMDFINAPIYVNVVLKIFLKFMNTKLKKRVHIHGYDQARLHKVVDPALLPKEYGGSAGTLQELTDYWVNRVTEHREWFLADGRHGCTNTEEKNLHLEA